MFNHSRIFWKGQKLEQKVHSMSYMTHGQPTPIPEISECAAMTSHISEFAYGPNGQTTAETIIVPTPEIITITSPKHSL